MPCFHDVPRGMTGHRAQPEPGGSHRLPHVDVGMAQDLDVRGQPGRDRACSTIRHSFVPGTRWSTSTPSRRPGPGSNSAMIAGQVVHAVHHLDDDALDAQVVAPDLLDELGVVAALDVDPRPARDPGPGALNGDRPARGTRRSLPRIGESGRRCGHRLGQGHRPAVDEEAGPEREGPDPPAAVLEVDDVHAAGLLDPDHGAHPAGLDLLDHEPRLRGHVGRSGRAGSAPVAVQDVGAVPVRAGG